MNGKWLSYNTGVNPLGDHPGTGGRLAMYVFESITEDEMMARADAKTPLVFTYKFARKGEETKEDKITTIKVSVDPKNVTFISDVVNGEETVEFLIKDYNYKYNVTFDTQGGSEVDAQSVIYGRHAEKPEDPKRTGYTLAKWIEKLDDGTEKVWWSPAFGTQGQEGYKAEINLFETENITKDVALTAVWSDPEVKFSTTVLFQGKVKIAFCFDLTDDLLADADAYYLVNYQGNESKVPLSESSTVTIGKNTYKAFVKESPIPEYKKDVTVSIVNGKGEKIKLVRRNADSTLGTLSDGDKAVTCSVYDYAVYAKAHGSEKMKALAKYLQYYGEAAAIYFGKLNPGDPTEVNAEVKAVTIADIGKDVEQTGTLPAGLSDTKFNVNFQSDNQFNVYYTPESGKTVKDYTFKVDGTEVTPIVASDGRFQLRVPNIAAPNLAVDHTFEVSDGTNTHVTTGSVIRYAATTLKKSQNQNMINLAKAIYLYYKAAKEYFGGN
jgi:hypothetical protein